MKFNLFFIVLFVFSIGSFANKLILVYDYGVYKKNVKLFKIKEECKYDIADSIILKDTYDKYFKWLKNDSLLKDTIDIVSIINKNKFTILYPNDSMSIKWYLNKKEIIDKHYKYFRVPKTNTDTLDVMLRYSKYQYERAKNDYNIFLVPNILLRLFLLAIPVYFLVTTLKNY